MSKNPNLTALVGAALAGLAAGVYISYSQGSWPFAGKGPENDADADNSGNDNDAASPSGAHARGAAAQVDVALTNEVASYTEHNPNNAADFTDDGATGNAD